MTTRTRTEGAFEESTQKYTTTTFGGSVVDYTFGPYEILRTGRKKTTTDVVTPNFRTRLDRGEIINNPFRSQQEEYWSHWTGHEIRTNSGSGSTIKTRAWDHLYASLDYWPDTWGGKLVGGEDTIKSVCTEAAANVDSDDVDGWVETGEGRQTIQLFDRRTYYILDRLNAQYRFLRKKGYSLPSDKRTQMLLNGSTAVVAASSEMADAWLLYRYGITPAIRLANDTLVKGNAIRTRRRTARAGDVVSTDWVSNHPAGGSYHPDAVWTINGTVSSSVRAGILYEYVNFSNKYGFNLDDLPEGFWNVCPWTFVVDWFVNAGSYIGAMTPKLHVKRLASWYGFHSVMTRTLSVDLGNVLSGYSVSKDCSGGSSTHQVTIKRRVPGILSPKLVAREGAIREILSGSTPKTADALALAFQQLKRVCLMKPPIRRGRVPVRYIGQ